MDTDSQDGDLHTQVLQTTLSEVESRTGSEGRTQDCCVICLDSISDHCIAQPCSHRNFDFVCLISWLEEKATCPLCKTPVEEVRYGAVHEPEQWTSTRCRLNGLFRRNPSLRPLGHLQHRRLRPGTASTSQLVAIVGQALPSYSSSSEQHSDALRRRRRVYRLQLYSLHVGSNRLSRYRDLTPALFASEPALVSKARRWIRRELQVFDHLSASPTPTNQTDTQDALPAAAAAAPAVKRRRRRVNISNAEFLLEYVVAILKTVDTQAASGAAEAMLADFLGRDDARLFLHELRAWLRSPFDSLEAFDRHVQYDESGGRRERERGRAEDTTDTDADAGEVGGRRLHGSYGRDYGGKDRFGSGGSRGDARRGGGGGRRRADDPRSARRGWHGDRWRPRDQRMLGRPTRRACIAGGLS